jgi:glycerol-3-phosphate dehydrogenase
LGKAAALSDLGRDFGGGVYEAELIYAATEEFAVSGDDFLWRRSKLGLHLDATIRDAIGAWFDQRRHATATASENTSGRLSMGGLR